MRIHHLNCTTLNTLFGAALLGGGGPFARARGVTHCLLVETDDGLLLVDTGLGTRDCLTPTTFMRWMIAVGGFPCDLEETAVKQVQRLGYRPEDVKHIALTHFHFDHAGGLPDFPWAKVHIYREEYEAVTRPRDMYERYPYRAEHWSHGPEWVVHDLQGDHWFDLECTPPLDLGSTELRFVPLTGHTRGHSGIALRTPVGWLLHCGDAYTFHGQVDPHHPTSLPYQCLTRPLINLNRAMRPIGKHAPRLRKLVRQHGDEVQLLCSHDPYDLQKFTAHPLEKSVLARLAQLNLSVNRISATGNLAERVSVSGTDELSGLAQAINGLLSRLEQAQIERGKTEMALRLHAYTLAQLNQLGQKLTASLSLQQIAEQLSHVVTEVMAVEGVSVWLLDEEDEEELVCWAACNQLGVEPEQSPVNMRVRADQGVVGWVMQHKERVIISDAASDERHFPGVDEQTHFQTRNLLAVPLQVRGSVIGVLEMVNKIGGAFTEDDLNLTEALAASVAIAIYNARLMWALRLHTVELERQNAELDAFAHTVAHDLKNPLSAVTAFSTMIEEQHGEMDPQQLSQDLQFITRNAHRMTSIINELLLLASVRKQEEVEIEPLDMAHIVAEARERLSGMMALHQGEVVVPGEWPVAVGYGPWVQEVWANYISNALKYGGRPPRVELGATEQEDGTIRFWVRDNGEGLSEEERENLFTEFTRLHQVRAEGYGLGLSIVRRIVEKLGGDVGVESEVGKGSLFYFTLPGSESR